MAPKNVRHQRFAKRFASVKTNFIFDNNRDAIVQIPMIPRLDLSQ
jgi:hypothetical protein